tara:strand:+ start:132 stop:335 length:204 start_codon:yes stop_codon:yes gene_type:complete
MKKYTVIKNKRPIKLTEEQIMKYKNFDKLFMGYEDLTKRKKIHLSKSKKRFLYLLLLALIAYILSML